jgi:hypothetical protein
LCSLIMQKSQDAATGLVPADLDREDATPNPGRWCHLGSVGS